MMELDGPDISKYGDVEPNGTGSGIEGLVEKPDAIDAPSDLASMGRNALTPNFFETLTGLNAGQVEKSSWQMRSTSMHSRVLSIPCA